MLPLQVIPKVTITSGWAIASHFCFANAFLPVVLSDYTNDEEYIAYKQALHRLIVSPSLLTYSSKNNAISVIEEGSALESMVSVQSVLDRGVRGTSEQSGVG
jgi:hypothetical protein